MAEEADETTLSLMEPGPRTPFGAEPALPSPTVPAATPSGPAPLSPAPSSPQAVPAVSAGRRSTRRLSISTASSRGSSSTRASSPRRTTPSVPLLERLKFHAIVASNLDEFFMVRVAGLKQQLTGEVGEVPPDGLTAARAARGDHRARVHELVDAAVPSSGTRELLPALAARRHVRPRQAGASSPPTRSPRSTSASTTRSSRSSRRSRSTRATRSRTCATRASTSASCSRARARREPGFGVVQVPTMLPRLIARASVRTGHASARSSCSRTSSRATSGRSSRGVRCKGVYAFRVTRNLDLEIDEEEAEDLLQTIQQELRRRERGNAVRLEVGGRAARPTRSRTLVQRAQARSRARRLPRRRLAQRRRPAWRCVPRDERRELRDEPFTPQVVPPLRDADDIFAVIREGDMLLHHPYESFDPVVEFVSRAAEDPDVLAIKQTLYRTGGDSPIVKALARAAENGKQVTAIVELKARFDEERNIQWARTLEQSGVHVVYGLLGLKTHAKCAARRAAREGRAAPLRPPRDRQLQPARPRGSTPTSGSSPRAPRHRRGRVVALQSAHRLQRAGRSGTRWSSRRSACTRRCSGSSRARPSTRAQGARRASSRKMNALVDADVIEALYRASQAGVPITLHRARHLLPAPGRPGRQRATSRCARSSIASSSTARIFHFANGGKDEVYISSADWMPRNFHRRVEVMVPILDPDIKNRLMNEVLALSRADNVKSWSLRLRRRIHAASRPAPGEVAVRAQSRFMELARERVKEGEAHIRSSGALPVRAGAPGRQERHPRRAPSSSAERAALVQRETPHLAHRTVSRSAFSRSFLIGASPPPRRNKSEWGSKGAGA